MALYVAMRKMNKMKAVFNVCFTLTIMNLRYPAFNV